MTVLLNGRKVGHEEIQRQQVGNTVVTTQTLVMDVERSRTTVPYTNISRSVETISGEPLSFSMNTTMSANDTKVDGVLLPNGDLQLTNTVGGDVRKSVTAWPGGALLVEGQRLAMLTAGQHRGLHYNLLVYNQASQQPMNLDVDVLGNERVSFPDHVETLTHQRETLRRSTGDQVVDLWLDAQGNLRKGSLSMLGQPLDLVACTESCADAPSQSVNMMGSATIDSPRLITPEMLGDFLSYRVRVTNKAAIKPFINTDEQNVVDLGNGEWQINVYRGMIDTEDPPTSADIQPNAWLQSDSPIIQRLADSAAGDSVNKMHVMGNLSKFVSRYLSQRGVDIGYASALEVARNRKGDCVEYAVLLAAMARAEDIPARVVVGMMYVERYGNKSRVFVPHAWVMAWVKGRWHSFDPAVERFDSGHIALETGDGNPWHFFNATNEFGSIQIHSVQTFADLYTMPSIGGQAGGGSGGGGSGGAK
ncbi:hypothetical protein GCM10010872_36010 [Dyella flava]|nr:hypothetical protein GCM10010872_36010 [Dyella flava]